MTYRMMISVVSILIAPVALSLTYGLEQYWVGSVAALGLGLWGLYAWKKVQSAWIADLFFAGVVLLVTIGGFLGLMTYLLLLALLCALGAWDLIRFQRRIEHSPFSEGILKIEKRHLTLLGLVLLGGGIFAGVMLTARMQISFGITLVLGVILIISLGGILRLLRN
jgi:hypothetical protein